MTSREKAIADEVQREKGGANKIWKNFFTDTIANLFKNYAKIFKEKSEYNDIEITNLTFLIKK